MTIEIKVYPYEIDGEPRCVGHDYWVISDAVGRDVVYIEVAGHKYKLSARDLIKALEKAADA